MDIIRLLDWQDQHNFYVIVVQRFSHCMDVFHFVQRNGGSIDEKLARLMMWGGNASRQCMLSPWSLPWGHQIREPADKLGEPWSQTNWLWMRQSPDRICLHKIQWCVLSLKTLVNQLTQYLMLRRHAVVMTKTSDKLFFLQEQLCTALPSTYWRVSSTESQQWFGL